MAAARSSTSVRRLAGQVWSGVRPLTAARAIELAAVLVFAVAWIVDGSPMMTGAGWGARTLVLLLMAGAWILTARADGPVIPLLVVTAVGVAWLNFDRLTAARTGGPALLVMLLVELWVCLRGTRREAFAAVAAGFAASLSYLFDGDVASVTGMMVVVGLGAVGARAHRAQQETLAALGRAQAALAAGAAEQERARIARDIHDVAAHSLAVTMLHLTGARLLAGRLGSAPGLIEALEQAEEAGRTSMRELRQVVGLLPPEARSPAARVPQARGADIPDLVATYRAAGLPVDLSVEGDLGDLPLVVGLAAYRVVQESLANVARHAAGAPTEVAIEVGEVSRVIVRDVNLNVREPRDAGHGLAGMRERVEALGGSLAAGPTGTGWRVEATLPDPTKRMPAGPA